MLQSSKMICQSHPFMCIGGFLVLVLEFFPILWLWSYKFASHALHMYLLYFSLAISVYFMHCAYLFAKYWQMVRFFLISLSLSTAVCCFISLNDLRFFSSINSRLLHVRILCFNMHSWNYQAIIQILNDILILRLGWNLCALHGLDGIS